MNPDADDLALLAEAAAGAARVALGFFRRDPKVWWKEGNSPVSEADLAVNRFLHDALAAARPGYGWLSEESEPADEDAASERFFVVDPIDGTRSFLRGEETWCVALAVVGPGGRPVAGVVDAPARDEVFLARRGAGATLNGAVLDLAAAADGPSETLAVAMPDGMRQRLDADALATLRHVASAPSLAYRIAQVAAARFDGTLVRPRASDWDIAAADLILEEAGGRLGDIEGGELLYKPAGRRHGLLVAGSREAWPRLQSLARAASA